MSRGSPVARWSRICLPMQEPQEIWVWSLCWEDPLEEEKTTHSSTLAWEILFSEEPGVHEITKNQTCLSDWKHTYSVSRTTANILLVHKKHLIKGPINEPTLGCVCRERQVEYHNGTNVYWVLAKSQALFLECILLQLLPVRSFGSPPFQFSSVTQSCPTLCDLMDCSTPGLHVHHQLPEFTQTHVHQVRDAIQPSHPLLSPSPAFILSQHQSLFKWVSSSHQVAKVLEFQLQPQSFQWTSRIDLL